MSSAQARSLTGMTIPTVIPVTRKPQAVDHDPFIDDLRAVRGDHHQAGTRREPPR
jgi:hypothetical protein